MEKIVEKILNLEGVKGVWFIEGEKIIERLILPLDPETSRRLKRIFSRLFLFFQERNIKKEIGVVFKHDYLFFKPTNMGWFTIWIKRETETSLALLRMEIEVILSEINKQKWSLLKKFKFW